MPTPTPPDFTTGESNSVDDRSDAQVREQLAVLTDIALAGQECPCAACKFLLALDEAARR